MSERTDISFDAALMMALRADAQRNWIHCQHQNNLKNFTRILLNGMNEWQWHYGGKNTVRC